MAALRILEYLEDVRIPCEASTQSEDSSPSFGELSIISGDIPQSRWSKDLGGCAKVEFLNENELEIFVAWVNRSGDICGKGAIAPKKKMVQNSFLGHTFAMTCGGEQYSYIYTPTANAPVGSIHQVIIKKHGVVILKAKAVAEDEPQNPEYDKVDVCGFTVMMAKKSGKNLFETMPGAKIALEFDLGHICQIIPSPALNFLQSTRIWLNDSYVYKNGAESGRNEPNAPPRATMCFHPSAEWLKDNGNLAEKGECVEVYRVKSWLQHRGYMPMVLLHELGHSYHWHLDYENPYIKDCYEKAMASGVYEEVPFILGGNRKAYATTNQMEYFSECTEAYWGMNDFWPFVQKELQQADPVGFEMCERIWHLSENEIKEMHEEALRRRAENSE